MTSQKIDEFIDTFKNIHKTTFIHKDIIYLKKNDDIIRDKQLNQELNKSDIEDLMKKLDIKSDLKSIRLGEFKTLTDKILGDDYNPIGYELKITMNDKVFYKLQRCIDDYKYIDDIKKATEILNQDMKRKENIYIKLLVNSYLSFMEKDFHKRTKLSSKLSSNLEQPISVYGGKKD